MSWAQDITGERYGKLVAFKCVGISVHKRRIWLCRCDCGNEVNVLANSLKTGRTISCGCFIKQKNKETFIKHGKVKTPEYKAWASMKVRCYNHNGIEWLRYGGRGISVCGRWLNSFENFLADMGEKPSPRHSLDRIDNDGNYEPNNCRWATRKQQANNKSSNRLLTFKGETLSLSAWSDKLKIHPSTLFKHKGLTPDEALAKIYDKHIMKQNKKWNKQV